ncbi:MAG: ABC transporter ATP-binding protein, partial [Bacteroidales bacterium]
MKNILKIFSYILPYKNYAFLNIIFNILSTIFSLFSFAMAIPFLGILFKTQPLITEPQPIDW